jgi:hypothetical protein
VQLAGRAKSTGERDGNLGVADLRSGRALGAALTELLLLLILLSVLLLLVVLGELLLLIRVLLLLLHGRGTVLLPLLWALVELGRRGLRSEQGVLEEVELLAVPR